MKATGIVRRIDDLGRVVIPKEIRRTMRIREGDPLEIYTDREGEVIFKKYSPIGELASFAAQYAETLYKTCSLSVVICDRDAVIACAGVSKKDYTDKTHNAPNRAKNPSNNAISQKPLDLLKEYENSLPSERMASFHKWLKDNYGTMIITELTEEQANEVCKIVKK